MENKRYYPTFKEILSKGIANKTIYFGANYNFYDLWTITNYNYNTITGSLTISIVKDGYAQQEIRNIGPNNSSYSYYDKYIATTLEEAKILHNNLIEKQLEILKNKKL